MIQSIRWCFALCIIFLLSFLSLTEASAATKLEVKATAGIQNKVKHSQGLPLTITVVNNGDDFSGDLVIDYSESYAVGSAKAIPFTVGSGETKTLNLTLPGLTPEFMYSGSETQMFYFYEDSWEHGKELEYIGDKSISPKFYEPETNFVLTLTESQDRLSPFSKIKLNGMTDTQVINLAQLNNFEFPSDGSAYGLANLIVVDEFVLADLPDEAQQAILDWVQTGGVVIVGASDNTAAELGLLSSQLPLNLSQERQQISKDVFANFTNKQQFSEDVSSFKATLNEQSRLLMQSDNQPLAAVKSIGTGAIIQTSFSLGDEPFSKEINASAFISELIKKANLGVFTYSKMNSGDQGIKETISYEVGQTNELFPSFQVSTPLMITIVIIYIMLVGPLLYFLLKRRDKREHAWWIIPTISILASVAIFAYGAKDRLIRPQIQQSSFYTVQEDASLSGYYIESLLSNRTGNFTFEAEPGTTMVGMKRMNAFSSPTGSVHSMSILQEMANKNRLIMRDVGFWSVSSVIGESHIKDVGKFAIDLSVESGNIRGTVKNEFSFTVKDVSIWSGTKMIEVGDLGPNESVGVNEPIGSAILLPIATGAIPYMGHSTMTQSSDLPKERKNSLIRMSQMTGKTTAHPAIIAHTEDAIVPISLVDSRAEMSAVNVLIQSFTPKTTMSGEFTLPSSAFDISVSPEDSSAHYEQIDESKFEGIMVNGSYMYEWIIPSSVPLKQVNWLELQLANTDTSTITIEIYNVSSKFYETVKSGRLSIKENVNQYISPDGKVQFKVTKQSLNGDDYTRLPELRLKGEVQK
ncbi:hypothetical protein [Paenisporosarcina sp. TG20]|uniref:DUF7408 domain-containing protein n=1 Tax=Paenisporosarcina sp. TG20 TaxID=1211706 RepID=UPI0003107421|nr:hypothetical protein [Paenisporosarcina sp. TG20]